MSTIKIRTSPQSKGRHQLEKGHILSLQTNNVFTVLSCVYQDLAGCLFCLRTDWQHPEYF